jgi:hypothetical protein
MYAAAMDLRRTGWTAGIADVHRTTLVPLRGPHLPATACLPYATLFSAARWCLLAVRVRTAGVARLARLLVGVHLYGLRLGSVGTALTLSNIVVVACYALPASTPYFLPAAVPPLIFTRQPLLPPVFNTNGFELDAVPHTVAAPCRRMRRLYPR